MSTQDFKHEKLAGLLRKLPLADLPEEFDKKFWHRFEREKDLPLVERPPVKPLMPAAASVLAAVFLLAAVCLVPFLKPEKPLAGIVSGGVEFISKNSGARPLAVHTRLAAGDRVKTGGKDWAVLELEHGYQIKINPNSEVVITRLKSSWAPGKTVLRLAQGELLVSIGDGSGKKYPLEIITPNAFARAMGTQFVVSAPSLGNPDSQVTVLRGSVRAGQVILNRPYERSALLIQQGYRTRITERHAPLSPQAIAQETRRELEELFQFSAKNRVILFISMSGARVRELLAPCVIYIRLEAESGLAGPLETLVEDIQDAATGESAEKHPVIARKLERLIEDQTELDRVPALLFIGAYYSYAGEYGEAVRVFEKISLEFPDSTFNSLSLMAAAILYEEKLGKPEKARELAKEILRRHPESYEAYEAALLFKTPAYPKDESASVPA